MEYSNKKEISISENLVKKEWDQPQMIQLNVKDTKGGSVIDLVETLVVTNGGASS